MASSDHNIRNPTHDMTRQLTSDLLGPDGVVTTCEKITVGVRIYDIKITDVDVHGTMWRRVEEFYLKR